MLYAACRSVAAERGVKWGVGSGECGGVWRCGC